ncbi:translesion DNA synthesis-associated protein ImuA [Glaciimonas sp. PCH181]|uniref:translesion DNA synthesis-associated protein ImuA n=1 Tax=Glaciimonas sp. PCH181 TaxID=2133943 RepID=UPI000D344EE5|nr:translesion DNA synthesis-associated protein ImuA [Glaciimonas sp. PCH181]PUA18576.1 cell division protein [Glaciimonas sp. PCH181]
MSANPRSVSQPGTSTISAAAQSLAETLPHALWRGNQMSTYRGAVIASGHAALDRELPNGGWPHSALIELLLQQAGIGEMHLLQPALKALTQQQRKIILLQPPHLPHIAAWSGWGLAAQRLLWINTSGSADALWSAEQILRNGSCGALLFWQSHIRTDALRRLHLAAQASDTMLWMIRPLSAAHESSPAPLRLLLRPAHNGIAVQLLKRRGPQHTQALYLAWPDNKQDSAAPSATIETQSFTPPAKRYTESNIKPAPAAQTSSASVAEPTLARVADF